MRSEHGEKHVLDRPGFVWPEPLQRWLSLAGDEGWLRTEEYHDGDTLVVRAELPGIDPDKDVEITVANGAVRIHGHREQQAEHKSKRGYRSEFHYGEFEREVVLPEGATADDVKATYKNGILEVRVPCPEKAKPVSSKVPVTKS